MQGRSLLQRELNGLIGGEATRRLVAAFGGTRVYIPTAPRLRPGHRLESAMGREAAERLCLEYGGVGDLKIPTCREGRKLDRRKIARLRSQATPVSRIALAACCTEKAVYEYFRRLRQGFDPLRQMDWMELD